MVVFQCDACRKECNPKDIILLAEFPRRTYKSARDAFGVKLTEFPDTTFKETHFCKECYNKVLNFTCIADECEHEWEPTNRCGGEANEYGARTYTIWKCGHCGEEKVVDD